MKLSGYMAFFVAAFVMLLAGCSVNSGDDQVPMNLNSENDIVKDKRFQLSSVLNHSPQVVILKPRERVVEKKSSGFSIGSLIGGIEGKKGEEYERDKSVDLGKEAEEKEKINGGSISNFKYRESPLHKSSGSYTRTEREDITFPVVAIAYGGATTVVKSVDGGFATLLLREKNRKNIHACNALFKTMVQMTNGEIEQAAENNDHLSRPTYWLDKRKAPSDATVKRSRSASLGKYVHLASAKAGSAPGNRTGQINAGAPANCREKLQHYHFKAAHSLIKRLGLFDRQGPFLVAWRDDGKKAMIVDLSLLENERDFKMAMRIWVKRIVQRPSIWEQGLIKSESFLEEINALLAKSGKSSISLRKPSRETISMN
ncbi:MAG: hypothetical protein ACRBBN_12225 [Methyloligellaceae bacterium]